MNPTIVKLRKHDQDTNEAVIRADALVRRESPSKFSSNSKMINKSQYGSEKKVWHPTAIRDFSLEQSNKSRMERYSPAKSCYMGNLSVSQGHSRMLRARSTTTLTPYQESMVSTS